LSLPHRYPFRFVDRSADGRAVVCSTADAFWTRGADPPPAAWLVEAVAQGAAVLLAPEDDLSGRRLALAAVEGAEFTRPPAPGETLEIVVALEARLGSLVRVRGEVRADGRPLGTAIVVLASS
jgi:3-hydroxymyristoyl/3-hydroxydecanoyl-(acyl carrier protein) dehydratase